MNMFLMSLIVQHMKATRTTRHRRVASWYSPHHVDSLCLDTIGLFAFTKEILN